MTFHNGRREERLEELLTNLPSELPGCIHRNSHLFRVRGRRLDGTVPNSYGPYTLSRFLRLGLSVSLFVLIPPTSPFSTRPTLVFLTTVLEITPSPSAIPPTNLWLDSLHAKTTPRSPLLCLQVPDRIQCLPLTYVSRFLCSITPNSPCIIYKPRHSI